MAYARAGVLAAGLGMWLAGAWPASDAAAASQLRRDFPCPGCLLQVPAAPSSESRPLLVALHGDNGAPAQLIELLRKEADRRGVLLLALACPRQQGCTTRSYWQWDGPPAWLSEQADAVAKVLPVDPARVYLLGWSGGASYITDRIADIPTRFAALVLLGGGMAPRRSEACSPCPAPAFFAVGDRNPYFRLAVAARDVLRDCRHALKWQPLSGKNHAAEWEEIARNQVAPMFDFLLAEKNRCRTPNPGTTAEKKE